MSLESFKEYTLCANNYLIKYSQLNDLLYCEDNRFSVKLAFLPLRTTLCSFIQSRLHPAAPQHVWMQNSYTYGVDDQRFA